MNSYGVAPTAPSRQRVYRFHHLGMLSLGFAPPEPPRALAGVEGLEPPTRGFGDRCSPKLSYTPRPLVQQDYSKGSETQSMERGHPLRRRGLLTAILR